MKVFLILASVTMLVSAAPQYQNSASGYDNSGASSLGALGGLDIAQLLQAVTRQTSAQAVPRQGYGSPQPQQQQQQQQQVQQAPQPAAPQGGYAASGNGNGNGNSNSGQGGYAASGNNGNGSGSGSGSGSGNGNGQQEQIIHKHVYIHVAPSEAPEPKAVKAPRAPLIPEKHYKILFIRTPEPAPYEAPEIPELPPAPETKTLVYVLLKKPDATPALVLPSAAPTKPSKPEVYFIRYKSPESAQNDEAAYGAPVAGGTPIGAQPASSSSAGGAPGASNQGGY